MARNSQLNSRVDYSPEDAPVVDFRALAECSSDIVLQIGPDDRVLYVSPSVTDVLGWDRSEILSRQWELVHKADRARAFARGLQLNTGLREKVLTTLRIHTRDGNFLWVEAAAHRLYDHWGHPNGYVVSLRDISLRKQLESQLEALARTDGLTGLANRRAFDETLLREWKIGRREKKPLSLLIADLDLFKSLNDHYGHQVGDDCLKAVSDAIHQAVRRPTDMAARYGGEELAIILPNTPKAGAEAVAEHVRATIAALEFPHEGNPDHGSVVTASVGGATAVFQHFFTSHDPADLISAADTALYEAKNAGRNRTAFSILDVVEG
jgi:diguanylate cyclase (GGDEF)-like protein/PAS domain S-box-containing protein